MDQHDLEDLQSVWETLAQNDPLWAILSVDEKRGNKWDLNDFFRTGLEEVQHVIKRVLDAGHPLSRHTALDFGCGVGRLSQALADYFAHVIGVDISPTMLALAKRLNTRSLRIEYVHNNADRLAMFADQQIDFVYSNLVLQHMPPKHALNYINEFFRITKPGGCIVFQLPSHLTDDYLPHDYTETPLDPAACRARLRVIGAAPAVLAPGESTVVRVEVANVSGENWKQSKIHQLNVGNHWLSAANGPFINDDGRSRLPGVLRSGEAVIVPLIVHAPTEGGNYYLEIDIVQEGVRWFKDAGSETSILPVRVVEPFSTAAPIFVAPNGPAPTASALPQFMMQGIPKDDILALISEAGASLLLCEENITEWYSYKYYVVR